MKNYNKILEAVNRGIQLALDDFDDEEQVQNIKSKQVQNRDYTKEYLDLMKEVVDLELPSGTLWCKYNLGASNGDTPKSWYGHYYMWGSTKPNDNDKCNWSTAPFNNGNNRYDVEYFEKHMYEFVDKNGNLYPEYDAAYQMDNRMHMPTTQQIQELVKETKHRWVYNYNGIVGLNGQLFIGKNGNTLFIPAAGCRELNNNTIPGNSCNLWTKSLNISNTSSAYQLKFDRFFDGFKSFAFYYRNSGYSIRGVI